MTPAIETTDLRKVFSTTFRKSMNALDGVSLRVEPASIFGLIGPNGAGKTTLVKILLGLAVPTSGAARLLGSPAGNSSTRRKVGYLPEAMRIPDHMQAHSFLQYMGELNGVDRATLKRRAPELLERVGLGNERKRVSAYSKGMLQRLGMAQSLINDPEVLFLDEPTDGLDPLGRKDVRDLLVTLREQGKTVFLNSHLLSEIELICDQIVILNRGSVARAATPAQFTEGTGEVLIRVSAAVPDMAGEWRGNVLHCHPRDRAELNAVIDRLRAAGVEIEAVEPVKLSLEQYFFQVVGK